MCRGISSSLLVPRRPLCCSLEMAWAAFEGLLLTVLKTILSKEALPLTMG